MNMSDTTFPKNRAHPIMIISAIAVILFCAAGTAAIMGWIPTSIGGNTDNSALATPAAQAAKKTVPPQAAAPVRHTHPKTESVRLAAAPAKTVCSNCGIVESTREITTRGEGSGLGAAGGAVVGGLLGNQVGGGHGKEAMTLVGAIGGAVAGHQIEAQVKATHSYETVVRMDNGSSRSIQQTAQPTWHSGDQVRIVDGVVRSNG